MNPHRRLFSHYPLAQLAIAFSGGICATNYFPGGPQYSFTLGGSLTILSLVFLIRKWLSAAGLALLLAFFFSGVTLAALEAREEQSSGIKKFLDEHAPSKPLTLTGVLDGPPEFSRDKVYLSVRVERLSFDGNEQTTSGRVWLLAPFRTTQTEHEYAALQLRYGTRIRVTTTLDRMGNYRNPGVSTLSEYLDRRDYDANGLVKSAASMMRLEDTNVFKPLAWLYEWRQRLQRAIDSRFDPETAGVLDAALLGNRYNLSRDAGERFREGGTFHVLVISGLHISFIGGVVFLAVRRLTRRRSVQFLLPASVVWSYSLAVGADASVLRAALMFTFAGFAVILFRQSTSLNALGGAALVLLVRSPKELFDPSFQLTFLSVLAIVVIAWPLLLAFSAIGAWHPTRMTPYPPACSRVVRSVCEILFWNEQKWQEELARSPHRYRLFKVRAAAWLERHHLQRFLRYTFGAMIVSVSVQLLLLPLMIVYFHRVSPASVVLNIVVSVLLAALVMAAMVALLVSQVSAAVSAPLFKLAHGIDWLMVHSVDPFSSLGLASLRLPEYSGPTALVYALYYLPLLLLIFALSHWRPLASQSERQCKWRRFVLPLAVAQMSLLIILILHPLSSGADGKLRVDFLDVGQGDAALVTMPDGTTLLIDGGGRPAFANTTEATRRIGETVVSEYLWWRGLNEVDYVLATHADADHIDGLNDVLKNFSVRGALVARRPANDAEFEKFSQTLTQTHTQLELIQAGDVIRFGDVELKVLWPPSETTGSDNNNSLVLQIKLGEHTILLTGDIEKAAERDLLSSQQQLRADVVKAPHHGSKTSSTENFVLATKPAFAIVSVGRNSMFGHPHEEVVQRWQASGATVLTTGDCGTITITTDGINLSLKTFVTPQKSTKNTNE